MKKIIYLEEALEKQVFSRDLREFVVPVRLMEFPELSQKLWRGHLWNGSYFVETIGSVGEDAVRKYIDHQQNVQR